MSRAMRGPHRAKGALQKFKQLLHPMTELETRELKLTDDMAHVLARGREEIDPTLGEFLGLSLR
jgi:hypothetical protein